MRWLRQSTAATIKLGPFVSTDDGLTALTSLTISQADVRLSKNGGDMAQKNDSNAATHDELGYYDVALNTTDTNTLGRLRVMVSEAGALPVWDDYFVIPANVYDSLVAGSDNLQVDVTQVGGATQDIATATALAVVDANVDAILVDTGTTIPATLAGLSTFDPSTDTVSADVVSISGDSAAADNLEAALDGTGGVTISADLDGSVASVDAPVDLATGAIDDAALGTITETLPVDVKKINGTTLTGNGTSGNEWGPA